MKKAKKQTELSKALDRRRKRAAIKKCLTFDPKKVTTIPANPKTRLRDGMVVDLVVKKKRKVGGRFHIHFARGPGFRSGN